MHGRLHSVRSYFRACPNCACVSHQALPALQSFPYDSAVLAAPQATDPWDFPLPSLPLQACWERGQISGRALLSLSHFQPRASSFCCLMMCKIQEVKIQITSHPPPRLPSQRHRRRQEAAGERPLLPQARWRHTGQRPLGGQRSGRKGRWPLQVTLWGDSTPPMAMPGPVVQCSP